MLTYERMTREEMNQSALLAAEAFYHYEYFSIYLPDEKRRRRCLDAMIKSEFRANWNNPEVVFITAKENGKILSFYCDDAESAAEVQNWPGIGIYLLPIPEVVLYREYGKLLEAIKPFC